MLPLAFAFYLGRRAGDLLYCLDFKHRSIVYSNLKVAFGNTEGPFDLKSVARKFYRSFGENLIEIFLLPRIDEKYFDKYVTIVGKEYIAEGFKKGKGVIFAVVHEGSWELSNAIGLYLGINFSFFFRQQRFPRLDKLLNSYRMKKGGRIIQRQSQLRQIMEVTRSNQSIGMTVDQGGKNGIQVCFFGKSCSMPSGAIRLALKHGVSVLPVFFARISGPYIKLIIEPPFEIKRSGDFRNDLHDNLARILRIFEGHIRQYPHEYLWSYKVWKYSLNRQILILSDKKTGHLRQSQALAKIAGSLYREKGIDYEVETIEVAFKSKIKSLALAISSCLSDKYNCQGCLWCLRTFLGEESYCSLIRIKPDLVISCGSRLAPVNYIISRENLAKSLVIMRPALLNVGRFDLVFMAEHDKPPRRKNIVRLEGALNLVDDNYLQSELSGFKPHLKIEKDTVIGVLIGGSTKKFQLGIDLLKKVVAEIKQATEAIGADLLITTSRRTPEAVEGLIKSEFGDYPYCKALVIANEKNIPQAVGGILAASNILVVSAESISMISEAVESGKYVVVFNAEGLGERHKAFLNNFARNKYIYLVLPEDISQVISYIWSSRPKIERAKDYAIAREALIRML